MSQFQFREIRLEHYRCFDELTLSLEEDTTVLFAENGGGKTALLTALATGLAAFQVDAAKFAKLDPKRDPALRTLDDGGRREPAGPCSIEWSAAVGDLDEVTWSTRVMSPPGRAKKAHRPIVEAIDGVRVPGEPWPLFAWYGVDRLGRQGRPRRIKWRGDRWEGYDHALDPNLDEAMLLQWLQDQMLGDVVRRQHQQPERFLHKAVMDATVRATPDVVSAWYDPVEEGPSVRFEDGHVTPWSELSDGYHVYIALVADIARRAVMLNGGQGAMDTAEGVVLIDELDLHLHPSWQRIALPGLRKAFPSASVRHNHALAAGAEQRREPPSAPPGRWPAPREWRVRGGAGHQRDSARPNGYG